MTRTLKRAPNSADAHLWADYFELSCLLNEDGRVSRGDAEERAEQLLDTDVQRLSGPTDPDPTASELVDGRKVAIDDLFQHLGYRASTFGPAYPFVLATDGRALVVRPSEDESSRRLRLLYVFLLVSSALEHLPRGEAENVASSFEGVVHDAVSHWLAGGAEVRHFGTRAANRPAFTGSLKDKVASLADALGETASKRDGVYREPNTGDGGLDVVAWFPFTDVARANLSIFVQATCRQDWVDKPGEIRYDKWKQRLTLLSQPPVVLAIPYCFRSPRGEWYLDGEITCVTIDRQRLLTLLHDEAPDLGPQTVAIVESFGRDALALAA